MIPELFTNKDDFLKSYDSWSKYLSPEVFPKNNLEYIISNIGNIYIYMRPTEFSLVKKDEEDKVIEVSSNMQAAIYFSTKELKVDLNVMGNIAEDLINLFKEEDNISKNIWDYEYSLHKNLSIKPEEFENNRRGIRLDARPIEPMEEQGLKTFSIQNNLKETLTIAFFEKQGIVVMTNNGAPVFRGQATDHFVKAYEILNKNLK